MINPHRYLFKVKRVWYVGEWSAAVNHHLGIFHIASFCSEAQLYMVCQLLVGLCYSERFCETFQPWLLQHDFHKLYTAFAHWRETFFVPIPVFNGDYCHKLKQDNKTTEKKILALNDYVC